MALCEVFYWGPMLFKTKVKPDEVQGLLKICNKNKKNDARKDLAGHIEDEFSVDMVEYSKIVEPYVKIFMKSYGHYYGQKCPDLFVKSAWVNFMKAGEYNPQHFHTGCQFSSVVFLSYPEGLRQENKAYVGTINKGGPGSLCFNYGEDSIPHSHNMRPFFPEIGDFFIFPYFLRHSVMPFKSEGERITLAANYDVKIEAK